MPIKRTQKEKAYSDDQDFHHFIDGVLDDEEYFDCYDAIEAAFKQLVAAKVIVSKTQFVVALKAMIGIPVPICEAAAICQCSRQYFRVLEERGKINIIRPKGSKKCFIAAADMLKYAKGKM